MKIIIILLFLFVLSLALCLWLLLGQGPRRHRAFRYARFLLDRGEWKMASDQLAAIQEESGLPAVWQDRVRAAVGECHQQAAEQLLKEKKFEESLRHSLEAATRLGQNADEQRTRVVEVMLAETRRLFAAGTGVKETQAVLQLVERTFAMQTLCPEASFWQGLCLMREQRIEEAITALTAAHEQAGKQFLDPAFYLGLLLSRKGQVQESVRYLSEANRVDGGCPFVTCQMGISLIAAGGDTGLALRALQRALGPKGFGKWSNRPDRAWVEAFPETHSYVRRLAAKYPYVCPVLGSDLTIITRQGRFALAQAQYRHGDFSESAELFGQLLQDSPPTVPLLRGLGLALARSGRYDQAFKHLRIALEQEDPKDPFTAGYLGLCGALGRPTQEEDKPRNIAWAIRLLARNPVFGDAEWAGLLSAVHAEARALGMTIGEDEQLQLCEVLASVHAVDVRAAGAYAHLAATFPDALRPQHAFLYARAATEHGCTSPRDLDLLTRTFAAPDNARAFFAEQEWDFGDTEYVFLQRRAAHEPGRFPAILGDEYPIRGERFLLERSRSEEEHGRKESARQCAEVLLRLAPASIAGHDRLACLHYRNGDRDRAIALLAGWHRLASEDPLPLVRQAAIEQERGQTARFAECIDRALDLTHGANRASIAFLGARLALREALGTNGTARVSERFSPHPNGRGSDKPALSQALTLLETCLREDPDHIDALWCLAAVRSILGDRAGLAALASTMNRPSVREARFHYFAAVCHLAAEDYDAVLESSQRAAMEDALAVESQFLMAWALIHQDNRGAAQQLLQRVALVEKSPSAVYARALLGRLNYDGGAYDEAIQWWSSIDPRQRGQWHLEEPLRQTVLLSGLLTYEGGNFEQAADRFREAGKIGLRDRRLESLLTLALVRAGQRLLYERKE